MKQGWIPKILVGLACTLLLANLAIMLLPLELPGSVSAAPTYTATLPTGTLTVAAQMVIPTASALPTTTTVAPTVTPATPASTAMPSAPSSTAGETPTAGGSESPVASEPTVTPNLPLMAKVTEPDGLCLRIAPGNNNNYGAVVHEDVVGVTAWTETTESEGKIIWYRVFYPAGSQHQYWVVGRVGDEGHYPRTLAPLKPTDNIDDSNLKVAPPPNTGQSSEKGGCRDKRPAPKR